MAETTQQDAIALLKEDHRTVAALFEKFEKATNPLVQRTAPTGFGRKASNQSFGRI